ncbi:MAG: hypothetical protein ACXWU2_04465 [Allosphingosinicella sp.]
MILPFMLAALLAAGAVQSAPAPAPSSEALVDQFLRVIPDAELFNRVDRTADPTELQRLGQFNPGRTDDIRPVLETYAGCVGPPRNRMTVHVLRTVARGIGDEKLRRLIAFYQSPDAATLNRLASRTTTLSAAEQAEIERITSAYPLAEFAAAMRPNNPAFWQQDQVAEILRCDGERDQAFARLGLRTAAN